MNIKQHFETSQKLLNARLDILALVRDETDAAVVEYGNAAIAKIDSELERLDSLVERVNLMTGEKFYEEPNTPRCCSPSSEAYWSM